MAEILLARVRDPAKPERLVVLKRMHRQLAVDREYVKMFVDEARLAVTLRHPNVVEVFESGEEDGQYYIAMEYLHGHDLRRVLSQMAKQRVPMRLANALAIARAVCRGLDYTHERTDASGDLLGIVHRDVSPHNVLVTYSGRVKLVDFGIAKTSIQLSRTRTGILKGKVAYMSPEQALGEQLDRRSDVFCIGILLWEMTTGHWLYRRKSELETLKAVVEHDAPLPSTVISGYPKELEQIVMKTLARRREDRWQSAGELGEALNAFAKQRRLDLRPAALSSLMAATFSDEVNAWHGARAAGVSLGDHLATEVERPGNVPALAKSNDPALGGLEDLPTTVVWPHHAAQSSSGWRLSRPAWLRRPGWLHWPDWLPAPPAGPAWLSSRWRWVVVAGVVALGAAGLLISELLHDPAPAEPASPAHPSTIPPAAASQPALLPEPPRHREPPTPPMPTTPASSEPASPSVAPAGHGAATAPAAPRPAAAGSDHRAAPARSEHRSAPPPQKSSEPRTQPAPAKPGEPRTAAGSARGDGDPAAPSSSGSAAAKPAAADPSATKGADGSGEPAVVPAPPASPATRKPAAAAQDGAPAAAPHKPSAPDPAPAIGKPAAGSDGERAAQ